MWVIGFVWNGHFWDLGCIQVLPLSNISFTDHMINWPYKGIYFLNMLDWDFALQNLEHLHPGKQLLYFKVEYCLMTTIPTQKFHRSPFKHSKTIYVFTSGWVIVIVQIHSRKKLLNELKWPLQNGPSIPESSRICARSCCKIYWKGAGVGWRYS